jgi:gliding motility associated protien GldN
MKKNILILLAITFCVLANAQNVLSTEVVSPEDMNSVYKKEKHHNKRVQPYAPLRQADVMWSRKIWRDIDLRQKINHPFYYPMNNGDVDQITTDDRKSLIDVIYTAVLEGTITAYDRPTYDDEFRFPMTPADIRNVGNAEQKITQVYDQKLIAQGVDAELALKDSVVNIPFDRNIIKKWRLKEEWFFDKQRSVMDVRILGMAPMQEDRDEVNNELLGTFSPIFWVYFPEARKVLINAEVFNLVKNDAERRTYDDIFWKRMFSSTIIKESSAADRKVSEYMVGLDALLEAERIKAEIFNIEHDLWEY